MQTVSDEGTINDTSTKGNTATSLGLGLSNLDGSRSSIDLNAGMNLLMIF
jgi:hypothetical protein